MKDICKLHEFPAHLDSMTKNDWQPLLDLIPELEKTMKFGKVEGGEKIEPGVFSMPYSNPSAVVWKFEQLAYEIGIVIDFPWMEWEEGRKLASADNLSIIDGLDLITCCKLITAILRNNRFCDGALVDFFESEVGLRVLRRMKEVVINF
jgi:hypothetical protein